MPSFTRREFVQKTALAAAAAQLVSSLRGAEKETPVKEVATVRALTPGVAELHWLDGQMPAALPGVTWGVPWPRGLHNPATSFALSASGQAVPVQTWPLAYWPDGSLKWTAHATSADVHAPEGLSLAVGTSAQPKVALTAIESAEGIEITTGVIKVRVAKAGRVLIPLVERGGLPILTQGQLVVQRQDQPGASAQPEAFQGEISAVVLEQAGPVRAVVKLTGKHANATGRAWLLFTVRLYFYAGGETIRVVHTLVHDGDEQKDFIRGLGLSFQVPMRGALYDRHVRFAGVDDGLFGEAVQGVTGLRRDPGEEVRAAQIAGKKTPAIATWSGSVSSKLNYVPTFSDWTLFQSSADGFEIRKRTREGFTWLSSARGQRASGLGWVGTPEGGVAFGLRNFWESHPAQLDIRGATSDVATVTVWMWAPDAGSMDLRSYHDGMGQDTFEKQNAGLDITYEDYEPGFDKPAGVARTSELFLWCLAATPTRARLVELTYALRQPPVLMVRPEYLHACGVFGGLWSPVDRTKPAKARLEEQIDWHFSYYQLQQQQRRWYGFWNYGDVMHTYDADRHEWRYDVGGFAWDNSELSTDLWLWLYFLRTGRADAFRFAEAMTRHTGEVDVHHVGPFAPLGSRHNVLHWGCSAKQLRISTAANRRYYYFLTGDERVGDLMREQIEAARALVRIRPGRKLGARAGGAPDPARPESTDENFAGVGFGTDWGALSSAWLTEWERTGDKAMRARLVASMQTIGQQPRGFFTGGQSMNLSTGEFAISKDKRVTVSHLNAVFGLVEVCAELIQLIEEPGFKRAWLEYCELYSASGEEQTRRLGTRLRGNSLTQGHSRLTAYAAKAAGDTAMARRAWEEFYRVEGPAGGRAPKFQTKRIVGPDVLAPLDEAAFISSNGTAQWGLAAIQNLALVGDAIP